MARLSRRAVNNTVILAMLAMIALFNLHLFIPAPKPQPLVTLIPASAHVLKIAYPSFSIERVGGSFVYKPYIESNISASERVGLWQQTTVTSVEPIEKPNQTPFKVTIWLAGDAEQHVFNFYTEGAGGAIMMYRDSWFAVDAHSVAKLQYMKGKQAPVNEE